MFILSIFFLVLAALLFVATRFAPTDMNGLRYYTLGSGLLACLAVAAFLLSCFSVVKPSTVGVVVSFGKVQPEVLAEGPHLIMPWQDVHPVSLAFDVAAATKSEAASHDQQVVHSDLTANYRVDPTKAKDLYQLLPTLRYEEAFVVPAMHEVFKAVMARYTAEQLITQRQEVSAAISTALNERLDQYHLKVQTVNLVNFGFSKVYNDSIEQKVTASQMAQTAERDKERIRFVAESRVLQAQGEADAIRIQAEAIEKAGGSNYLQLQAIQKWDGKLPAYMTSGTNPPFIQVR